jgi:aldehyde dehydrogenase (NAD+)
MDRRSGRPGSSSFSRGTTIAALRAAERIRSLRRPSTCLGDHALKHPDPAVPAWKIVPAPLWGNTVAWKPSDMVPLISHPLMEALFKAVLPQRAT